jgi:hypothetical protein
VNRDHARARRSVFKRARAYAYIHGPTLFLLSLQSLAFAWGVVGVVIGVGFVAAVITAAFAFTTLAAALTLWDEERPC